MLRRLLLLLLLPACEPIVDAGAEGEGEDGGACPEAFSGAGAARGGVCHAHEDESVAAGCDARTRPCLDDNVCVIQFEYGYCAPPTERAFEEPCHREEGLVCAEGYECSDDAFACLTVDGGPCLRNRDCFSQICGGNGLCRPAP